MDNGMFMGTRRILDKSRRKAQGGKKENLFLGRLLFDN